MKKLFIILALFFGINISFAQEKYPEYVEKVIDKSRAEIIRMYELTELKAAFWVPAFSVSQRFNGYSISGQKNIIPVSITTFDIQIFRFTRGFGTFRAYVQTPFSSDSAKYGLLNDTFVGFGGVGGGVVFDNRKVKSFNDKSIVSGTAVSFTGEGYSLSDTENKGIRIGGGGAEVRVIHNFHQFFGINAGLNFSAGSISVKGSEGSSGFVSFGGSIGLTF